MKKQENALKGFLPPGWEDAAKSEGALVRNRQIKTPEELLHLNLLYLTEAGSYQNTSTLMELSTGVRLNKEATRKRIQGSWQWLRWMTQQLCLEQGYAQEPPAWLAGRRVQLADATDVALRGSNGTDYRLHYLFDLFACACTQMELTPIAEGGEKLSRFSATPEDIFVADRIYGAISGMEHLRASGACFVLRLKTKAFTLYDAEGNVIDLLPHLRRSQHGSRFRCAASTKVRTERAIPSASSPHEKMRMRLQERIASFRGTPAVSNRERYRLRQGKWVSTLCWRQTYRMQRIECSCYTVPAGRSNVFSADLRACFPSGNRREATLIL